MEPWEARVRPRYADLFRKMRDPDLARRDEAFDAVLFDRGEAIPDLIIGYKFSKDPVFRFDMVQLMAFSEDPRAFEPLLAALEDNEANVRMEACIGLGELRNPKAIPHLQKRLNDLTPDVREAAEEALEHLGASS